MENGCDFFLSRSVASVQLLEKGDGEDSRKVISLAKTNASWDLGSGIEEQAQAATAAAATAASASAEGAEGAEGDGEKEVLLSKWVINAAGLGARHVGDLYNAETFEIKPRRGQFVVYDKAASGLLRHVLAPLPDCTGKGILLFPTIFDNVIAVSNSSFITTLCFCKPSPNTL